ncbi:heterokaryon incompatibility protein-domain-containing protein [Tricladium varicosporioides]|nr:heterokaryon incompatibility protein-domain-containing protein [Hymenoscyphus varicosporioides]
MPLCEKCRNIFLNAEPSVDSPQSLQYHHLSPFMLASSAARCELCALFLNVLLDSIFGTNSLEHWFHDDPILLRLSNEGKSVYTSGFGAGSNISCIELCPRLRRFSRFLQIKSTLKLDVYAQLGSLAITQGQIGAWNPRTSSGSPGAHALIKWWLETCHTSHQECHLTISGEMIEDERAQSQLPTRVIDVGPPDGSEEPRLIDSNGRTANYVALSWCWGSDPKRAPPSTLHANLEERFNCLPFADLPKTFQDAIVVTRAIDIRYLWIDAICIIQDDHDDWAREAPQMGRVYQRSRLTIAASHAQDSFQGLFLPHPDMPLPVELPYHDPLSRDSSTQQGSIFIKKRAKENDRQPSLGPLGKRAWITQEWCLSRRTVFYTRAGLVWCCRCLCSTEDGHILENPGIIPHWDTIVERYSRRSLTRSTDKLVALQGLATELQRARPSDHYLSGLWAQDLPLNLLWHGRQRLTATPPELRIPSWSWASKMGSLTFLKYLDNQAQICLGKTDILDSKLIAECQKKVLYGFAEVSHHYSPIFAMFHSDDSIKALGFGLETDGICSREPRWRSRFIYAHIDQLTNEEDRSSLDGVDYSEKLAVHLIMENDVSPLGCALFDSGSIREGSAVFAIPLYRRRFLIQNDEGENETMSIFWGLMVRSYERVGVDAKSFERLGIFGVFSDVWFDGVLMEKITIE